MPQNRNNKGDLFNIQNIDEAKRLVQQILDILNKGHTSASQYMKDNAEIIKLYDQLNSLANQQLSLTNDNLYAERNRTKLYQELVGYQRNIFDAYDTEIEKQAKINYAVQERTKELQKQKELHQNIKDLEKEAHDTGVERLQKLTEQAKDEYAQLSIAQKLLMSQSDYINKRVGAFGQTYSNRVNNYYAINGNITEKDINRLADETEKQVLKDSSDLVKGGKNLTVAAQGLQLAGNTLKEVASKFKDLFAGGINRQSDAYENSFTNISVRNGTTRSQYYGAQSQVNNILSSMGLNENIATSQVQEMWNTLASEGIKVDLTDQETTTKAIETILTNQIVPYLDMSSTYMQKLATDNPNLMKQVRGIGTSIQNVEGSNVVANEYLQDMMNSLSPMAELANQEIGLQYADTLGQLENLRNQGYSDSQIGELYGNLKTMVDDPYAALTSGDTMQRITTANMLSSGADLHDSSAWLRQYMYATTNMANQVPEGNWSSLYAGIMHNSLGGLSTSFWDTTNVKNINPFLSSQAGYAARNGVNSAANIATESFRNDQNQTNKTLQNITLENFMNELSVINEWMGNWTNVIVNAITGIGGIIKTVVGGKIASSLLGGKASGILGGVSNGLNSAGTFIGSGLANGFSNAAPTAIGAGKIGALTGTGGAIAGAAGVLAGGAMAVKGGMDVYNDFQSGDVNAGTALSGIGAAGGAVGAGALLAFGASNPIGWVALAIGGAGLLGRKLYDLATETGDISDELQEQTNEVMKNYQETHNKEIDSLNEVRDQLLKSNDAEEQKQLLINAGIATQEELNDEMYNNKQALVDLTDQYIASQKELNGAAEELVSQLENKDNEQQNSISTGMFSILDKNYNEMSDSDKQAAAEFGKKYYSWLQEQAASGNEDASWRLDKMDKNGINLLDDEFTSKDLDAIMHYGVNSTSNKLVKSFMTDSDNVHNITTNKAIQEALGLDSSFSKTDWTTAANYIESAINSNDNDTTNNYLAQAKAMGLTYDVLSKMSPELTKQLNDKGISSYRQGINDVPADQLAYLHQGEAVLTASTANELRNMTDTYRETTTQSANIDAIIQEQTSSLITKMDEIIKVILTGTTNTTGNTTNTSSTKLWNSMINMQSTKNF